MLRDFLSTIGTHLKSCTFNFIREKYDIDIDISISMSYSIST